ncbi:hypothetical protein [Leptolyngbya sp. FACHB-16]|uniref:hypothetical protein n=1 Tax=unclassified Leptolyngbya TaxID=2650499 RepID=UPI0016880964|nr:hypothetical protein [Leptolyngbya sp. FACHB-16]MBD2156281.1 hypothetical protein [Leptolyngbya sp. FACHB-16]
MPVLVGGKKPKKQFKAGGWIAVGLGLPAALILVAIGNWQENKSEPAPQVAVRQSSPAPAAPAPVRSVAPVQPEGIGVSRTAIQSVFERPGVDFQFERTPNSGGQQRVRGTSPNGLATIELIGPPDELVSATIMIDASNANTGLQEQNAIYTLGFIKYAAPEWVGGQDWFQRNLDRLAEGTSNETYTTFSDKSVELSLLRDIGIISLSITAD